MLLFGYCKGWMKAVLRAAAINGVAVHRSRNKIGVGPMAMTAVVTIVLVVVVHRLFDGMGL